MLGADTCGCEGMEVIALIKGDLKGFVCRLLPRLCNALCDLEGVGSAFADLKREAGVGVSGACTEGCAFLADENVARGGDTIWVEG